MLKDGVEITNPFLDETGRTEVNPQLYYGIAETYPGVMDCPNCDGPWENSGGSEMHQPIQWKGKTIAFCFLVCEMCSQEFFYSVEENDDNM